MNLNGLYRKTVLGLAANRVVTATATKVGMKLGAARFVAGQTLPQTLDVIRTLNRRGILVTLDHLGEGVFEADVAKEMAATYIEMLDGIAQSGVKANVSLKLTQMGLSFDKQLAEENVLAIVRKAAETANFVRIDMEDTPYTDTTLAIYRRLRDAGYDNVGTVIQAYLYRSRDDIAALTKTEANLRIVKGAYVEPANLAFPAKADVDENYRQIVASMLDSGCYTGIATHDEKIIQWAKEFAQQHQIPRDKFEFQMLFGVRTSLQESLAAEGYQVRCYVPYGEMWYPYFTRRIAERPGNLWFVLKNAVKG